MNRVFQILVVVLALTIVSLQVAMASQYCEDSTDCPTGHVCKKFKCMLPDECTKDWDCGDHQRCEQGKCVVDYECYIDRDCKSGFVCFDHSCITRIKCSPGHHLDGDCGKNRECTPRGHCVRIGNQVCAYDADCPEHHDCSPLGLCQMNPEYRIETVQRAEEEKAIRTKIFLGEIAEGDTSRKKYREALSEEQVRSFRSERDMAVSELNGEPVATEAVKDKSNKKN